MLESNSKKSILIVDDHAIVREGLSKLITQERDLIVCGEAADRTEALTLLDEKNPDVVVLDLSIDQRGMIDFIETIRRQHPGVTVLVLTMYDESYFAERALRAGATGFMTKQEAIEDVLTAIHSLLSGKMYVSDRISPKLVKRLLHGGKTV